MDLRNPQRLVLSAILLWLGLFVLSTLNAQPLPYYKSEKIIVGETWMKNVHASQSPRVLRSPAIGSAYFNKAGSGYLLTYNNLGVAEYDTIVFIADGEIQAFALKNQLIHTREDYFIVNAGESVLLDVLENDESYSNITLRDVPFEECITATVQGNKIRLETDMPGLTYFYYTACDDAGHCDEARVTVYVMDPKTNRNTIVLSEVAEQQLTLPLPGPDFQLVRSTVDHVYPDGTGKFDVDFFHRDMGENEILFENPDGESLLYSINFIDKWGENRINTCDMIFLHPGKPVEVDLTRNDLWTNVYSVQSVSPNIQVKRTGGGRVLITPNPGFSGKAQFNYVTCAYPRCDTTMVNVFVDHFQPAKDQFDFYVDPSVPYHIPFFTPTQDYQLTVIDQPDQGNLEVSVEGNSLIYTPNSEFKGEDRARIQYSYKTPGGYFESLHYIRFLPSSHPFRGQCSDCVWPGDADGNGMVDLADVKPIARYLGEMGTTRSEGTVWKGQWSSVWLNFENNKLHHADANGDGIISQEDLQVISNFYGKTHGLYADPVTWMDVPIDIIHSKDYISPGDDMIFEFYVGDAQHRLFNVTGFSTEIDVEGHHIIPSNIEVIRDEENWLKGHQPTMSIKAMSADNGQVAAGEYRTRSVGVQGYGTALKLRIIVEDEVEGFRSLRAKSNGLKFIFRNMKIHTQNGVIHLPEQEIEIPVKPAGEPEPDNMKEPKVFPNPAKDEITIHWPETGTQSSLEVIGLQGKQYKHYELEADVRGGKMMIDYLPAGIYILRWKSGDKVWNEKLTIVN